MAVPNIPQGLIDAFMATQSGPRRWPAKQHVKPAEQKTQFWDDLKRAFPRSSFTYTGGWDLKPKNESANLPIDLILVTGAYTEAATTICDRFANDFGYYHLNVNAYLSALDEQKLQPKDPTLCGVHPISLKHLVEEDKEVPIFYLTRIVRYRVALLMEDGHRKVLLSGFPDRAETVMKLRKEVARIRAVFRFSDSRRKDSADVSMDGTDEAKEEEMEGPRWKLGNCPVVSVASSGELDGAEAGYEVLLAKIAEGACAKPRPRFEQDRSEQPSDYSTPAETGEDSMVH